MVAMRARLATNFGRATLFVALVLLGRVDGLRAQVSGVQPVFRAQMALANPEVRQGRIHCQLNRLTRWGNALSKKSGGTESLRFEQGDRGTSMHYKFTSANSRLLIDAWEHELSMVREQLADGAVTDAVRFEQRSGQPLSLEVTQGESTSRLTGESVWHLWLADRELCQRQLAPLVELLGLSKPWTQFTEALETRLFFLADAGQAHDAAVWRVWLSQLADDDYAVREAADRQLRAAGTALAPFVRRLDMSQLDAEQRYRLRRIMAEHQAAEAADTVDSTAEWLADDPRIWLAFLDHEDVARRATAARQIERLLESPITFAADADDATRASQIEALEARIGRVFDRH